MAAVAVSRRLRNRPPSYERQDRLTLAARYRGQSKRLLGYDRIEAFVVLGLRADRPLLVGRQIGSLDCGKGPEVTGG